MGYYGYMEFEIRFLLALVDAADAAERGQCEAFEVTQAVLPQVKEQWVRDAVRSYQQQGYLGPVGSRPLDGRIILTISAEARKATESLKAQIAATQQPKPRWDTKALFGDGLCGLKCSYY